MTAVRGAVYCCELWLPISFSFFFFLFFFFWVAFCTLIGLSRVESGFGLAWGMCEAFIEDTVC
jgi:hypothetical protein